MIVERPMDDGVFIVTAIEADGPLPGTNSMRAFASVAIDLAGVERGSFEAVLEPLKDASPDPNTLAWFETEPQAWIAATEGARPAAEVMSDFVHWVNSFAGGRTFAAYPLAFDGAWIDHYLRRFTPHALVEGHYARGRLFDGSGLCLKSFVAGFTGREAWDCNPKTLPQAWFGGIAHTHRAIDDARGYARLLAALRTRPRLEA